MDNGENAEVGPRVEWLVLLGLRSKGLGAVVCTNVVAVSRASAGANRPHHRLHRPCGEEAFETRAFTSILVLVLVHVLLLKACLRGIILIEPHVEDRCWKSTRDSGGDTQDSGVRTASSAFLSVDGGNRP